MFEVSYLSVLTFLPLLGALFIILISEDDEATMRRNTFSVAFFTSFLTFILSLYIWYNFDPNISGYQFEEKYSWIDSLNIGYHVGVDGISLPFVVLSAFLTPVAILASINSIKNNIKLYMASFLILETFMVGSFIALDFILFYLFFEGVLIPMFLIIGIWGGEDRIYATFKLFLYTLLGSVFMLVAILYMYSVAGTTDIVELTKYDFAINVQKLLWLAFFASFAVKIPMWPVHTWLPDAHVQAPTAGSVILAGVLIKMGGYGLIRFSIPMFPDASIYFAPLVYSLSIVAIIYTSLVALAQKDMKKLIAYSSVAHMGYVTLGLFTFNEQGIQGAVMQMVSHGIVSAALFMCVGVVYDRMHTREISAYGGIVEKMPNYAFTFMVFTLASIGLPGTSGFVGEVLVLIGAFKISYLLTILAGTAMIIGAGYALWLFKRVVLGKLEKEELLSLDDIRVHERYPLFAMLALAIYFGFYPDPLLRLFDSPAKKITTTMIVAKSNSLNGIATVKSDINYNFSNKTLKKKV